MCPKAVRTDKFTAPSTGEGGGSASKNHKLQMRTSREIMIARYFQPKEDENLPVF